MKYQNRRNGKVVKVVEQNEKFKTVIIEFEDGKTQNITTSTFKRWYKKVEEEVVEQVVEEQPVEEAEVVKPVSIAECEKEESEEQQVVITARDEVVKELVDYFQVMEGVTVRMWNPYYAAVKVNGKPVLEFRVLKKGTVTLYTKESYLPEGVDFTAINNYYLPCVVKGIDKNTIKKIF